MAANTRPSFGDARLDGDHCGNAVPILDAPWQRDLYLQAGADVQGVVVAENLRFRGGPIRVSRSVVAGGSITAEIDHHDPIDIRGSIAALQSLVMVHDRGRGYVRVSGEVVSGHARLERLICFGNIYAQSIQIKNSIVLGGLYAARTLTCEQTIMGTFMAEDAIIGSSNVLLSGQALGLRSITLSSALKTFLPASRSLSRLLSVDSDQFDEICLELTNKHVSEIPADDLPDKVIERINGLPVPLSVQLLAPSPGFYLSRECLRWIARDKRVLEALADFVNSVDTTAKQLEALDRSLLGLVGVE